MGEGRKILLVEDNAIIAMDMELSLSEAGWRVIGPVATAQQAFDHIRDGLPDLAILDFNIRGGTSEEIALALMEESVPVVFLSGDNTTTQIESLKNCPVLSKPVAFGTIHALLVRQFEGK